MLLFVFVFLFAGPLIMTFCKILKIPVDRNCLGCGMVGYCGASPADQHILQLLLMYNNSRGGDATGWVIDDAIEKDTDPVDKFMQKHKVVIRPEHKNYTVIMHARKASSGSKHSKNLAHPFGVFANGVEKDKYDLVLAMNGSFTNEDEFADHFEFDFKKSLNSDTEMLAKVMAKLGNQNYIEALEKYDGAATLLFYTPRAKNTLMVFKDPLRPLCYHQQAEDRIYISSMKESLIAVGFPEAEIKEFEDDHIYRIVKGKIAQSIKVTRSPLKKVVSYGRHAATDYTNWTAGCGPSSRSNPPRRDDSFPKTSNPTYYELGIDAMDKGGDRLYLNYDKYFRNHHPVTGEFFVNDEGIILQSDKDKRYTNDFVRRYFMVGYMMKNKEAYEELKSIVWDGTDVDWIKFSSLATSGLVKYVDYPIMMIGNKQQYWVAPQDWRETNLKEINDTATFSHFLSEYTLTFKLTDFFIQEHPEHKCLLIESYAKKAKTESVETTEGVMRKILEGYNISDVKSFIRIQIKQDETLTAQQLYNRARLILFKMNGRDELEQFFYKTCFLEMCTNEISGYYHSQAETLSADARRLYWSHDSIQKKLDELIVRFRTYLSVKSSVLGKQGTEPTVEFEDLPRKDRVKLSDMNHSGISVKQTIEGLKKSNKFFSDVAFQKDMFNPTLGTFEEFAGKYTSFKSIAEEEAAEFAAAIMYSLADATVIKQLELVDALKQDNIELVHRAGLRYDQYYRDCMLEKVEERDMGKALVDAEGEFHYKDTEEEAHVEEEHIAPENIKEYDSEDAESEIEDTLLANIESLEFLMGKIAETPAKLKTERITIIEEVISETIEDIKSKLFDIDDMSNKSTTD